MKLIYNYRNSTSITLVKYSVKKYVITIKIYLCTPLEIYQID